MVGITLDHEINAYVSGRTSSSEFPTTSGCYDNSYNGENDVFVFMLNFDGSDLLYSTFIGGSDHDSGSGITIDRENNAYVTGYTNSVDFPTTSGCYDDSNNGGSYSNADAYILKLNVDGSDLLYSTFIGGTDTDVGFDLDIDSENNAYITGYTSSEDFPTTSGCYDDSYNGDLNDVFVVKLSLLKEDDINKEEDDPSLIVAVIVLGGIVGLIVLLFISENLRYLLTSILIIPLYSKIEKDDILDHPNRQKIYSHLYGNPGINLTTLHRNMNMGYGTLVHHLNVLEKNKFIHSKKEMGFKLFHLNDSGLRNGKADMEFLLSSSQNRIIEYLTENGTASRRDMEIALDINPNTIQDHLRRLREWNLVAKIGRGKDTKYEAIEFQN